MQHRAGDPKAKNGWEVARGEGTACHRPALGLTPCTVFEPQNSAPPETRNGLVLRGPKGGPQLTYADSKGQPGVRVWGLSQARQLRCGFLQRSARWRPTRMPTNGRDALPRCVFVVSLTYDPLTLPTPGTGHSELLPCPALTHRPGRAPGPRRKQGE